MQASIPNFRTLFPEFEDPPYTDEKVQFYLDLAAEMHGCSETAQLYLAAHFAAEDADSGIGESGTVPGDTVGAGDGFAKTQKVGDLSATYVSPESYEAGAIATTPYGKRALQLMKAAKTRLTVGVYE